MMIHKLVTNWTTMCLLATMTWISWPVSLCAQPAGANGNSQLNGEQAWQGHQEVEQCAWCHYQPGNKFASRPTDFCRLVEASHWLSSDTHATSRRRIEPLPDGDARAQPSNARSRRIVDKLGYQVESAAGYQKFCENCLTCHAGYKSLLQQTFRSPHDGPPGISCVYCHQTDDRAAWIDLHGAASAPKSWRLLSPETKQSHGMRHLASATAQARLCYSCHIGDLSQDMFVSHAMYVAGHPPLPGVELHSLTQATSPHWRTPSELYQSLAGQPQERETYFAQNDLAISAKAPAGDATSSSLGELRWQAQATAVGALQAQRQWLTLIEQTTTAQHERHWADYALYDCAGCHHGLQTSRPGNPSWRQQHRRLAPPGRPLPTQWPTTIELAITQDYADQLNPSREAFLQAITVVPFGDRTQVARAAKSYREALENTTSSIALASLEPGFSRKALDHLLSTPPIQLSDYESARQLHWAAMSFSVGVAAEELVPDPTGYDPAIFSEKLKRWRSDKK